MSVGKVLKRKAKGERPYFFNDPSVDRVVSMVMGLAGEVAVLHDRLDTLERLLEAQGGLKRDAIEAYKPSAAVAAERAEWRETFLGEVLRIVEIEVEALTMGDTAKYDTAIRAVEKDAPALGKQSASRRKTSSSAKKTVARKFK